MLSSHLSRAAAWAHGKGAVYSPFHLLPHLCSVLLWTRRLFRVLLSCLTFGPGNVPAVASAYFFGLSAFCSHDYFCDPPDHTSPSASAVSSVDRPGCCDVGAIFGQTGRSQMMAPEEHWSLFVFLSYHLWEEQTLYLCHFLLNLQTSIFLWRNSFLPLQVFLGRTQQN